METRDILDQYGAVIGSLTLPNTTTEEEWQERLSCYIVIEEEEPQP